MENVRANRNSYDENIISWSPIIAGILIALTIGVLFDLLGLGIGFSLFSPNREVGVTLTIGTLIWLMITSAGSMYSGGWIAGRYGDAGTSSAGAAHGLVVSAAAILIMLVVTLAAAGSLLSSSLSALQSVMSVAGSAAANAPSAIEKGVDKFSKMAPGLSRKVKNSLPDLQPVIDELSRKAEAFLPKTNDASASNDNTGATEKNASQLDNFLPDFLNSIDNGNYEEARKKLIDRLAELSGKSPEEVSRTVDEWKQKYQEAKEKVKQKTAEATKAAAKTISKIALVNFFLLVIGMVAGAAGGLSGVRCKFR